MTDWKQATAELVQAAFQLLLLVHLPVYQRPFLPHQQINSCLVCGNHLWGAGNTWPPVCSAGDPDTEGYLHFSHYRVELACLQSRAELQFVDVESSTWVPLKLLWHSWFLSLCWCFETFVALLYLNVVGKRRMWRLVGLINRRSHVLQKELESLFGESDRQADSTVWLLIWRWMEWWLRGKRSSSWRVVKTRAAQRWGASWTSMSSVSQSLLAFTCFLSSSPPPSPPTPAPQQTSYQTWLIAVIWTLGSH